MAPSLEVIQYDYTRITTVHKLGSVWQSDRLSAMNACASRAQRSRASSQLPGTVHLKVCTLNAGHEQLLVSHRAETQQQQQSRPQWVEDALRKQRQSTVQPPPTAAGAGTSRGGARASVAEDRERPLEVVAEQLDVPEPREKTHARRSGESRAREPSERAERLAPEPTPPAERKTPKRKEKERRRDPLDSAPRCVS